MKKAFVDQMLFGFVLFMVLIFFLATLFDEQKVKNDATNLKTLALDAGNSLASIYIRSIDEGNMAYDAMCIAKDLTKKLTNKSPFPNNAYTIEWRSDTSSGLPTSVTVNTAVYESSTFWYRFLNKNKFNLGSVSYTADLTSVTKEKNFSYLGVPDAVKYNVVGIYEPGTRADGTICIKNKPKPRLILTDKKQKLGINLGSFNKNSKIFFITNGKKGNSNNKPISAIDNNSTIELTNLCNGANTQAKYKITGSNGKKYIGRHKNKKDFNVFFEDEKLNIDYDENNQDNSHFRKIARNEYNAYLVFSGDTSTLTSAQREAGYLWIKKNIKVSDYYKDCREKNCFKKWQDFIKTHPDTMTREKDLGNDYVLLTENYSDNPKYSAYKNDKDYTDMSFDIRISNKYLQKEEIAKAKYLLGTNTCP